MMLKVEILAQVFVVGLGLVERRGELLELQVLLSWDLMGGL